MSEFLLLLLVKIPSIAGIGGFISGIFIKKLKYALAAGAAFGIADAIALQLVRFTDVGIVSWAAAITAGLLSSSLSWWLWGRKRA